MNRAVVFCGNSGMMILQENRLLLKDESAGAVFPKILTAGEQNISNSILNSIK